MTEKIKENKGKITIGGMTAVAALVLLLLNIYEKTESLLAKATPSSDKNYNVEKYMPSDYETREASKK